MEEREPFHPRQLDAMERDVLAAWISELLHGRHAIATPVEGRYPAELLASAFFLTRGETRALIQRILVGFLDELAHGPSGRWHSAAGQELLRAIPRVVFDHQRERAWDLLRMIAGEPDHFAHGANCHLLALQAILDLRFQSGFVDFKLDADYWRGVKVCEPYRAQYLTTILEGIVRTSAPEAINWLACQPYDGDLSRAVAYLLPTLVRIPSFQPALEKRRLELDTRLCDTIDTFFQRATHQSVLETDVTARQRAIKTALHEFQEVGVDDGWFDDARQALLGLHVEQALEARFGEVHHG